MEIRKQNDIKKERRKEQRSSNSTEEHVNHTEETQHGPPQITPNIGAKQENGKKWNKRIRWSQEKMKEVLWCFMYIKEITFGENYKAVYKLWRERNPKTKTNVHAKLLLNQKNYILKANRIPAIDTTDTQENIRCTIWKDRTKGMNSDNRMVTINQRGEEEINNMGSLGKNSETEAGDHTIRNKLKEELQIMWQKVRLLQMSEREMLQKLKDNRKLVKLKNEINGIIE
jgi:hypothetical protein